MRQLLDRLLLQSRDKNFCMPQSESPTFWSRIWMYQCCASARFDHISHAYPHRRRAAKPRMLCITGHYNGAQRPTKLGTFLRRDCTDLGLSTILGFDFW